MCPCCLCPCGWPGVGFVELAEIFPLTVVPVPANNTSFAYITCLLNASGIPFVSQFVLSARGFFRFVISLLNVLIFTEIFAVLPLNFPVEIIVSEHTPSLIKSFTSTPSLTEASEIPRSVAFIL